MKLFIALLAVIPLAAQEVAEVKVALRAQPFPPAQVRLLDSPFKAAMDRNAEYLMRLEPDRLLSKFRENAGLKPKGEPYKGWEAMGIAGHSLGHYLSAVSMMHAATREPRFLERVNYIVDELAECQAAGKDGYVAAIPEGRRVFEEIARGRIETRRFNLNGVWVPWYTMHKVMAGLRDAHVLAGSAKALAVLRRIGDWALEVTRGLSHQQFQEMLYAEYGGMNEALAELYALTGEAKYLELSQRFLDSEIFDPLMRREDKLWGYHSNTQVPKLIGAARLHELTGRQDLGTAARFFWQTMTRHHSYAIGGNSDEEYLGPAGKLAGRLSESTAETCNTYNMLKLTRHVFAWEPSEEAAAYYERAVYNHILPSQDPKTGMLCYFTPLQAGARKNYSRPFDSFWCCVGSGMENHTRYGESIYWHKGNTLWVNLLIPSTLDWPEQGLKLRQDTRLPESDVVRFEITAAAPVTLTLRLRRPAWASARASILVNGGAVRATAGADGFVGVEREWKNGDRLELRLPMSPRLEAMPDDPQRVAVLYGPVVLAGELGDAAGENAGDLLVRGTRVSDWLKPVEGQAARFRTASLRNQREVTLAPFHTVHHQRYAVYWDLLTPDAEKRREQERKAEEARRGDLEARTVDRVVFGDKESEKSHDLKGQRMDTRRHHGRAYLATENGWFSFELKPPDKRAELVCTYWGSDSRMGAFDILVEGRSVGRQTLNYQQPGRFMDIAYTVPPELTSGKQTVTVRFQSVGKATAGRVSECRMAAAR